MKKVSVQAYEDRSRLEGGHAIVLLQGLAEAPDAATFRLRPVDASHDATAPGWPGGDLTPVSSRMTGEGFEIVVGPEVTDSELLLPGVVVEIELPAGDVRGEFMWPNVAPQLRQRRRSVVINKQRRNGRPDMPQAPKADVRPDATVAKVAEEAATAEVPDVVISSPADTAEAGIAAAAAQPSAAQISVASSDVAPGQPGGGDTVTSSQAAKPLPERPVAREPAPSLASMAGTTAFADKRAASAAASPSSGAAVAPSQPVPQVVRPMTQQMPRAESSSLNAQEAVFYSHARAGRIDPGKPSRAPRKSGGTTIALQAIAGLIAGVAALYVLSRESSMRTVAPTIPETPAFSTAAGPAPVAAAPSPTFVVPSARPGAEHESSLYDTLAAGPASPRGVAATNVPPTKALENANAHLSASGGARDTDEAGFWLKRYITGSFSDERTVRALTQLGSVYAEPGAGRSPDYGKARQLWEIAGAAGDPVAMCFIGLLHENGLGTAVDKKAAQRWYERSKGAGGCPSVDESIARVKQ